jgi:hypothetical protein
MIHGINKNSVRTKNSGGDKMDGGVNMVNQSNQPQMAEFRQTLNTYTKQWCTPKKKVGNKWVPITNLKYLITKQEGVGYALWRLRTSMMKLKCTTHSQQVWDCPKIGVTKRGIYNVYYLTCKRFKHSISGIM